jgi:hypothetical protein
MKDRFWLPHGVSIYRQCSMNIHQDILCHSAIPLFHAFAPFRECVTSCRTRAFTLEKERWCGVYFSFPHTRPLRVPAASVSPDLFPLGGNHSVRVSRTRPPHSQQ